MTAKMDKMMASQEEMMAEMKAWQGVMHACLEKESAPEETEVVAKSQEVPEEATDEETIGAAKDRSRNLRLAAGCRGQLKTRTKHDGRSRQKCAAAIGRLTSGIVPAMRKGHVRRGPCKKCCSGIGQSKASHSGKSGRIVKRDRHLEGKKTHREAI
jgi:hypothetical protein